MSDDMTECPVGGGLAESAAMRQLPTLQRNALRKLFDRPAFTPEEVAALGYRRLQQAEGIGHKGLAAIGEWLRRHGFELRPPELPEAPPAVPRTTRRHIEMAVRLLRTHGYTVEGGGELPGGRTNEQLQPRPISK